MLSLDMLGIVRWFQNISNFRTPCCGYSGRFKVFLRSCICQGIMSLPMLTSQNGLDTIGACSNESFFSRWWRHIFDPWWNIKKYLNLGMQTEQDRTSRCTLRWVCLKTGCPKFWWLICHGLSSFSPPWMATFPLYPDKATCGTGGYLEARADFWGTSRGQGGSVDMDYTPFLNIWCQHVSSN